MKVTTTWLRNCLGRTILEQVSDAEIVAALEKSGLEIEQISYSKPIDPLVISCSVKKVVQHPAADRLKIAEISTGKNTLVVVCGAPNVRAGMKAALAQIGTILPNGDTITAAKLRGVESQGMLCSPRELGLGDDHSGLLELDGAVESGISLDQLYPADTIIDLKTPANRFDVQSIWGIARDVAAIVGQKPKLDIDMYARFSHNPAVVGLTHGNRPLLLVNVKVPQALATPDWMAARLRAVGQRSRGLLVDVTNYVMLETGQPLHAYDAKKLVLPLAVRLARQGEKLVTLDGVERQLSVDDLVVADAKAAVGLAGIMGGQASEVSDATTEIWLEAGVFDAVSVRKTAQRQGIRTEASARFERRLPLQMPQAGISRALELLQQCAEVEIIEAVWGGDQPPVTPLILPLTVSWVQRMSGIQVTVEEIRDLLQRLGFGCQVKSGLMQVTVPWWRPDVTTKEDVLEEIVRVEGYDKVPATLPVWRPRTIQFDQERRWRERICQMLSASGLFEVMTYSFVAGEQINKLEHTHEHLALLNPLSSEQAYLRTNLLASHLKVAERNRTYAKAMAFYEMSKVFWGQGDGTLPEEPTRLALTIVQSDKAYPRVKGLLDGLALLLNSPVTVKPSAIPNMIVGRCGEIWLQDRVIGTIGQLTTDLVQSHKINQQIAYLEVDIKAWIDMARPTRYLAPPRYPVTQRDISVWVPIAKTWSELSGLLAPWAPEYVGNYNGQGTPVGHTGLTIRLTVAHPDKTPTDAEANEAVDKAMAILERRAGALRRD